jgi:lipopolysaccharide export system protein LptC
MRAQRQPAERAGVRSLSLPARGQFFRRGRAVDRYSRRVALLKRVLPAIGVTLLLLVAAWPRLVPLWESVRLSLPKIDLREGRELKMLNPRYAGLDREGRPFVLTAKVGRQAPDRNDLMSLERPKAELTLRPGTVVSLSAATALYQTQAQRLDLFDDVALVHSNGTRFTTRRAHADLAASTADGNDPVQGVGPSGAIAAQGFRIADKGGEIVFAGPAQLVLKGAPPRQASPPPAAVPAEVARAAAAVEAAALAQPAPVNTPPPAAKPAPPAVPSHAAPSPAVPSHAAPSHAAGKPHPATDKARAAPRPAKAGAAKGKRHAG